MSNMNDFLLQHNPGAELKTYASQFRTLEQFWEQCPRIDWMLWVLERYDRDAVRPELRLFACACARTVWSQLADPRSRSAVDTAEAYGHDKLMGIDLQMARDAAYRVVEDFIREGDLVSARYASIAQATTLSSAMDAAKTICARLLEASQSALLYQSCGGPASNRTSMKLANLLRATLPEPFRPTQKPNRAVPHGGLLRIPMPEPRRQPTQF